MIAEAKLYTYMEDQNLGSLAIEATVSDLILSYWKLQPLSYILAELLVYLVCLKRQRFQSSLKSYLCCQAIA